MLLQRTVTCFRPPYFSRALPSWHRTFSISHPTHMSKDNGSSNSGTGLTATPESAGSAFFTFPYHSKFPQLTINSSKFTDNQAYSFILRTEYTLSQVGASLREDLPHLKSVVFYRNPLTGTAKSADPYAVTAIGATPETPPASEFEKWSRWASGTALEEILRDGFRETGEEQRPIVWAQFNDTLLPIVLPSFKERTAEHRDQLQICQKRLEPMQVIKRNCDSQAERRSNRLLWTGLLGLVAQWSFLVRMTWWDSSWDEVEPFTFFITMGNSILAYSFFMIYRRNFSFETLSSITTSRQQLVLYERAGLDIQDYGHLMKRVQTLQDEIEEIQDEYQ